MRPLDGPQARPGIISVQSVVDGRKDLPEPHILASPHSWLR